MRVRAALFGAAPARGAVAVRAAGYALLLGATALSTAAVPQVTHPPDAYTPQQHPLGDLQDLTTKSARSATSKFAACVVEQYPAGVDAALDLPFYDLGSWRSSIKKMYLSRCLTRTGAGVLSMLPLVLRGALYEALYVRDFGALESNISFGSRHPAYPVARAEQRKPRDNEVTKAYDKFMTLGECVVRASPSDARDLVLSKVETPEEIAAVQNIARLVPRCTTESMSFSKSMLRMTIAEPLYRLSMLDRAGDSTVAAERAN